MELYVSSVYVYVYVEGIYGSNNCSMDMHVCSMFMRLCDIYYMLHIEGRQKASTCI